MKNKTLLTILLSLVCMVSVAFGISTFSVYAQETVKPSWVVNSSAPNLTVSEISDGGVGKISYYTVPSNSLLNEVTIPVKNYDIVDNYLSKLSACLF